MLSELDWFVFVLIPQWYPRLDFFVLSSHGFKRLITTSLCFSFPSNCCSNSPTSRGFSTLSSRPDTLVPLKVYCLTARRIYTAWLAHTPVTSGTTFFHANSLLKIKKKKIPVLRQYGYRPANTCHYVSSFSLGKY